jgi:general secretion pathway protein A
MIQELPDDPGAPIADLVDDARKGAAVATLAERSSLPLRHFSLASHPFADSVNPDYFYRTEAHEEAFLAMSQCIEDNVSLGLCTAISGTGKTLLTQVLLKELDSERYLPTLVLAYPGMSRSALLREIIGELGIEGLPARGGIHLSISAIQQHIIKQYLRGLRLVLIIDEVHFLKADALHLLRTLSNIEVPDHKLITVLLFGEQTFLAKMKHPTYRSIFSRMFARVQLRPLNESEVEQYVKFRMLVAGGSPEIVADSAIGPLHRLSGGVPREINRICHNALAAAAKAGVRRIEGDLISRMTPAPDAMEAAP